MVYVCVLNAFRYIKILVKVIRRVQLNYTVILRCLYKPWCLQFKNMQISVAVMVSN